MTEIRPQLDFQLPPAVVRPPTGSPPPVAPIQPDPVLADSSALARKGTALPQLSLLSEAEAPNWSPKVKQAIVASFRRGLQESKVSPETLSQWLRELQISAMPISEATIQDPAYAAEVKKIQNALNGRLNSPEAKKLGIAYAVEVDGQFGKGTVNALVALQASQRGPAVSVPVTALEQTTRTGCYRTSEAMLFNAIHGKDGTLEAYDEFDARDRIQEKDLHRTTYGVGVLNEDGRGRLTVSRTSAYRVLDAIDKTLDQNQPLIVGVSYRAQDGHEYNEGITDHYVLISGRGYDSEGLYYEFKDPANGGSGKFRLEAMTGKLAGVGDMAGIYNVTAATVYEAKPEATAQYQRLGKLVLYPGQQGPEVQKAQTMLTWLGHSTNGTEGRYGSGTSGAVSAFQQRFPTDLAQTGTVDSRTLTALKREFQAWQSAHPAQVVFKPGDKHAQIAELQQLLIQLGFNTKNTSGRFSPQTEVAVAAFKQAYQIPVSDPAGQIDNQTWLKMLEVAASKGIR